MAVSGINPWSAGAIVIDQRPFLSFYERQMARQQAKQDAMDNYFRDLNKNVTSSGMRSQDVPNLLKKNQEWQQFYQQNKSAILNPKEDNGVAYNEYMHRYQDQLGLVNESKEAMKTMDQVGKMRLNPQMSYIADDPNFINDIQKHELPIGDPNRQGINLATIAIPPKPIDTKEREAHRNYLTGGLKPDEIPGITENLPNFVTRTPITKQFSDQNLRVIGQRSMDSYDTDRAWRIEGNKIFQEIQHDPIKYQELNILHKSIFGNDIDTPKEALAAQNMMENKIQSTEYKEGKDEWGLAQARAKLQHGYTLDEIAARQKLKDKSEAQQDTVIDDLYDSIKIDALKNKATYQPDKGSPYEQYEMKASGAVRKMFAVPDSKGHLMYPDAVRFSKDFTTVTPIFLEHYVDENTGSRLEEVVKDKAGKSKVIRELSQPILEPEFKQRWKKELMGAGAYSKELGKGSSKNTDEDVDIESLRTKYDY